MPIINRVADMHDEITAWRRDIHANPEILYEVHRTAGIVADKLKAFGCDEVVPGIGRTGVVGVIRGRKAGAKVVGLRADMDALPMTEATGLPYASKTPGRMHACGHDGHTAMLLGAARYLCETRNFDGTAIVIFQPAEEGGAGGKAMVDDGLMDRWNIQEVYGMHNGPGIPVGQFAIRPGPMLAASDRISIEVTGKGGHAARPHECIDTVLVASHIVTAPAVHRVAQRRPDPVGRDLDLHVPFRRGRERHPRHGDAQRHRPLAHPRRPRPAGAAHRRSGGRRRRSCTGPPPRRTTSAAIPVTSNHARQTEFAAGVAKQVAGADKVETNAPPIMGGEDFAYMLEARPGAFIFVGNGATASVHNPQYDFNDQAIPVGVSYWARLVETAMPA